MAFLVLCMSNEMHVADISHIYPREEAQLGWGTAINFSLKSLLELLVERSFNSRITDWFPEDTAKNVCDDWEGSNVWVRKGGGRRGEHRKGLGSVGWPMKFGSWSRKIIERLGGFLAPFEMTVVNGAAESTKTIIRCTRSHSTTVMKDIPKGKSTHEPNSLHYIIQWNSIFFRKNVKGTPTGNHS